MSILSMANISSPNPNISRSLPEACDVLLNPVAGCAAKLALLTISSLIKSCSHPIEVFGTYFTPLYINGYATMDMQLRNQLYFLMI